MKLLIKHIEVNYYLTQTKITRIGHLLKHKNIIEHVEEK